MLQIFSLETDTFLQIKNKKDDKIMHIKEIKISELQEFIESDLFISSKEIPITTHRAISQINNPRADANDIVLIVAYNENNDLLAFAGALPDKIFGKHKIAWNSCWYANNKLGKTIALPIFLHFATIWNGKILLRDLTNHTRKIIKNFSFFKAVKVEQSERFLTRFYLSDLLAKKKPSLSYLSFPLKYVDILLNSFISLRQLVWEKRHVISKSVQSEVILQTDAQTSNYIRLKNQKELIQRGTEELEWILNYPWVVEKTKQNESLIQKYYFSSVTKSFNFYRLKISDDKKQIGYFIIKERDCHFEIPYAYFDDNYLKDVSICLIKYMHNKKIKTLNVVNDKLRKGFKEIKFPYIFSNKKIYELFASNELLGIMGTDFELQDGDGDGAFT